MQTVVFSETELSSDAPRLIAPLVYDWRFTRAAPSGAAKVDLDDSAWQRVRVPHDWAISGPFDRENDIQRTIIEADGERQVSEHTGRTGGLPHVGLGWYRKRFFLPESARGRKLWVEFDGVMSNAIVYLNGRSVGTWPYGYSSFQFDLTGHASFGKENVLVVRVDNPPASSRWYPGAGIYRNVRLVLTHPVRVAPWGVFITTPEIDEERAVVQVRTEILSETGEDRSLKLVTQILDPRGRRVATVTTKPRTKNPGAVIEQRLRIRKPLRWDVDAPNLYTAITSIELDGSVVDSCQTSFGIRHLRFDANDGFFLNGRNLKFKGVCQHHDLGALGAAVSRRALERQLEMLKDMGCNAIRTSHNPPTPELLDLCDEMGFLVIDEAFDEWSVPKLENGYHKLFNEWAEKDLRAMIRRDRNHPCVVMWSIGNEIPEQSREDGASVAKFLSDICHDEDCTRPTTAGFNLPHHAIPKGMAAVVDVPGWNYKPHLYREYHLEHPNWPTYGSETESCISSRGEYYFPVEEERDRQRETLHVTSYDVSAPPWAYSPEYEFLAQDCYPFIMGEFVWTGWDYLGEPTPYKHQWPSRSSYFGIIDLAGIPKDRFYLYRSVWAPEKETLHLLPHWTWPGREGEITPVHCYTNYPAAELFLNGVSLGVRRKAERTENPELEMDDPRVGNGLSSLMGRYRLVWDDVRYEPGTLKVVAMDATGQPVAEREICTAGEPARVELFVDRPVIHADGHDLAFITARIVDAAGNLCPRADHLLQFALEGPGEIAGVDNGNQASVEPFQADFRHAFNGFCVAIVRSRDQQPGTVHLTASCEKLAGATAVIRSE